MHTQAPGPHLSPVTHYAGRVPPRNTSEGDYFRTRSFLGKLDQVQETRAFAAEFAGDSPVADDVVLCVSEFSANAVLHSHSGKPDGQFLVRVEMHAPKYTWVEVEDDGGPWESPPGDRLPGHGLDIVSGLASEWGVDGDQSGWIVWARVDWPRHQGRIRSYAGRLSHPSGGLQAG